jgi:glycosyltransferase involved in cell wall biosynthesis
LARALAKQQATRAPDVVLVSYKKEQLLVALLPAFLTRAVVWTEWGPVPRQFRRGLARRCYLLAARRARRIIAVSETTRRSLIDVGIEAHKIAVVENLVDPEQIRFRQDARKAYRDTWQLKEEDFVVGCITRFHHKKRNDVIVDALARMDMRAVLVLAGDGDDEARLRQRAQPLGNRVRFLPTPRGCVAEFLSACDVQVVAPSNSEGAPRSVVIGQLTARPVIAVSAEGVSDMIEPGTGAIVSPPNDAAALARCLSDYRGDVRRRLQEGRAGRAYAKTRYEPDGVLTRFEDLLYEARQP